MKFNLQAKLLPVLASAIALGVAAAPAMVQAQEAQPGQNRPRPGQMHKGNKLNLTDAQKTQMNQIRQETRTQIENVLTPEQRQQLQAGGQQGRQGWRGLANANLSAEQRTQIQNIMQASKQRAEAVLTPEQRQEMQQMRQNMQNRRQNGNGQSGRSNWNRQPGRVGQ